MNSISGASLDAFIDAPQLRGSLSVSACAVQPRAPADAAASASIPVAIRNPLVVVASFAEVDSAVQWVTGLGPADSPRVTFVHVVDTAPYFRGLEFGGSSPIGFLVDAERTGGRLLEMVRTAAPGSISVTTRLLIAPVSCADQILRVIAEVPCCDAVVVCTPVRPLRLSSTGRMIRRLRSRSAVPILALDPARSHKRLSKRLAWRSRGLA
jgi:hypothetical protein